MTTETKKTVRLGGAMLVATFLLAAGGTAVARNDQVLLPIDGALKAGSGIPVRFGSATKVSGDRVIGMVDAHGVARPSGGTGNSSNGFKSERRSDAEICQEALRMAVSQLQSGARAMGAAEVVGVMGSHIGSGLDSQTQYECRMGHTRGVVDLRGQAVRAAP
jgi:hypothetical protein